MGPSHSRCKPELLRHDRSIGCLQITCLLRNLVVYSLWICQSHERILHRKAPFGGSRRWNHEKLVFYAERAGAANEVLHSGAKAHLLPRVSGQLEGHRSWCERNSGKRGEGNWGERGEGGQGGEGGEGGEEGEEGEEGEAEEDEEGREAEGRGGGEGGEGGEGGK